MRILLKSRRTGGNSDHKYIVLFILTPIFDETSRHVPAVVFSPVYVAQSSDFSFSPASTPRQSCQDTYSGSPLQLTVQAGTWIEFGKSRTSTPHSIPCSPSRLSLGYLLQASNILSSTPRVVTRLFSTQLLCLLRRRPKEYNLKRPADFTTFNEGLSSLSYSSSCNRNATE